MTLASTLFGGGSAARIVSGAGYGLLTTTQNDSGAVADTDFLVPFTAPRTMTIDAVAWRRDAVTASNTYVGVYSRAGVLLTDCAVDADTTAGWHSVSTTAVTLTGQTKYWISINSSGAWFFAGAAVNILGEQEATEASPFDYGAQYRVIPAISKARTNAALLSNLVLSGWAEAAAVPALKVIAA